MGDTNLGPEPSLEQKPNMKAEKEEWPQSGPTHIPPQLPASTSQAPRASADGEKGKTQRG